MDLAALYREHGPAIYAACRQATGNDRAAAQLAPRVFVRVQRRPDDLELVARTAHELATTLKGPRLLRDPAPPTPEEIDRARDRFAREVFSRTLPLVERDQRPPRVLRWLTVFAPLWVVGAAIMGLSLARMRSPENVALELRAGDRRLYAGATVRRGEAVRVTIDRGDFEYVTVYNGPRLVQHIDHAVARRVELDRPIVVEETPFRVTVDFRHSPRGVPAKRTGIELDVE